MSLEQQISYSCPHCNSKQSLQFYKSVNVTLQPELKSKVLSGQLNSQTCNHCHKEINIMSGFLYHDMEQRLLLTFNPDKVDTDTSISDMIAEFGDKGYIIRIVNSYPKLVEYIKLFDLQLNDQVINIVKKALLTTLRTSLKEVTEVNEDTEIHLFFDAYEKRIFKKELSFIFFLHPSQMMKIKYDLKKLSKSDRHLLFDLESLRN